MKYALITGASSGMGAVYADRLARLGYGIVAVSNRREENDAAARRLSERYRTDVHAIYADLTERDAAQRLYDIAAERGLEIEILISNAGMLLFSQLSNTSPQNLDRITALHCRTPMQLCRLFGSDMQRRGRGYILIVSSATAYMPYPTISHYAATKAFLRSFACSLWYEMRPCGVGVTALFPGAVDTPLYSLDEKHRRRLRRCGVMISPEKVVDKALGAMFRRRRRCIPGWFNSVTTAICALLPAHALLPILRLPPVKRLLARL